MMVKRLALVMAAVFSLVPVAGGAAVERGIAARAIAPTGETVNGKQWLFVVGIDSYLQWPRLSTAVNDARAVKDVLLKKYHFDDRYLIELYDADATRKNILGAFRRLAQSVKPEDSLLVFYAGHGHLDSITKEGSWIPVESGTADPSAWISNHDIKNYLKADAIKAKHILLISDSCFAGDFFRGHRGGPAEVTDTVIKKAYERSSRQALTSGGVEPVSDAGFGGNSVFSHFLVAALKENNKPHLIPSEIFPQVKAGVAQNAEQFPQLGALHGVGGQEGGEYVFFLKETRLEGLSAEAEAKQVQLERWRTMESEAEALRQKEQAEIARREQELSSLDAQIAAIKTKLGTRAAGPDDSLQTMLAMVRQKEEQAARLEELRRQREAEERKRRDEIAALKREAEAKRRSAVEADIAAYEQILRSPFGKDMRAPAWQSLVGKYPAAMELRDGDLPGFRLLIIEGRKPNFIDPVTGMEFVFIKGGCFQMGSPAEERGPDDERPRHEVCLDDFFLGKHEATNAQFRRFRPAHDSGAFRTHNLNDDQQPVVYVSWEDARSFADWLSQQTPKKFRLPTEAEWEYAARAGSVTSRPWGDDPDQACRHANVADLNMKNFLSYRSIHQCDDGHLATAPVGRFAPNDFALHDMIGNVWEWVQDWYRPNYYAKSPKDNPPGPAAGSDRTIRGGSWNFLMQSARSAARQGVAPGFRDDNLGFRLAFPSEPSPRNAGGSAVAGNVVVPPLHGLR